MCLLKTIHMVLLNYHKFVHPLGGLLRMRIGEVQISCQLHGNCKRGSIMLGTSHYYATPGRIARTPVNKSFTHYISIRYRYCIT
jgi:hypothetical protein